MAAYLLDTNILLRAFKTDKPEFHMIRIALESLHRGKNDLYYTSQNLIEFWNVVTRPVDRNGFGLSTEQADNEARVIENAFLLLPNNDAIHHEWRRLVVAHSVSGVQVHDARLVAAMHVHGITNLLTTDIQDFNRYSDITVVHPREIPS